MRSLYVAFLSSGLLLGVIDQPAPYGSTSAQPSPAKQPAAIATSMDEVIANIQRSNEPSAVIEAFADGLAIDRNSVVLLDAYVTRMVQLDLPNLAAEQSDRLLELQPNHSLARALVASGDAQDGNMPA